MCLFRGAKVGFHAKMKLHIAAGEPASTAFGEFRWFGKFRHTQDIVIKRASLLFGANRHGKLYVIDCAKWKFRHLTILGASPHDFPFGAN